MRTDVHQHLWSEPLVEGLAAREELPFVRLERGLTVLYQAGERPYVIDRAGEEPGSPRGARRSATDWTARCSASRVRSASSVSRASRPRRCSTPTTRARSRSAGRSGCGARSPSIGPDPQDVDRALDRGCVGVSLPAGALAGSDELLALRSVLDRLEARGAPLFVHPGPGLDSGPAAGAAPRWASRCGGPR